ncbi:MAG: DNA helicase RecQ [Campylobacterales bacterium]|nr:DNA helicase RecQ [Campylobacterales bacterium]
MTKKEVLKKVFGFSSFRGIQEKAIDKILEKQDLLTILPTGSGKSLIYQLPTLMMEGTTVVISPLIALMQDQITNLQVNNISCGMISSINTNEENDKTYEDLLEGKLKFLYIAPERFTSEYFLNNLRKTNINFFVIDEAHCVSEWGHEFRDDYRKLKFLKDYFPTIPITAFTATATKSVEEDILKTLSIKTEVLKTTMKRDNLIVRSQKRVGNGLGQIEEFLRTHEDECGIIYCFTRKETEQLSETLEKQGFDTLAYHAGLPATTRDGIFSKFKNEEVKIIVATIAFGMGIDKSNIRFVVHTSMPKTLENYTQEIGRAGRDGLKSDVLLLYSKADEIGKKRFIDELPESTYKTNNYKKLDQMYRFSISSKCRHQFIADYFDDEIEVCESLCDNCVGGDKEMKDITVESQKFISAVLRTEERFGQTYIIDVLRGSKAKRILDFGHDNLSVFGIGKDLKKEHWQGVADRLLDIEALVIEGEFRTLKVTSIGRQILKGEKVDIDASHFVIEKSFKEYKKEEPKNETFEKFRELRGNLAKEESVPAYLIFSDKTLIEISNKLPTTESEFLGISGVGEAKLEKYGEIFIDFCKEIKETDPKPQKELTKTYLETLELIEEGKSLNEICEVRELKEGTVIGHIEKLLENSYLSQEQKQELYQPLIDGFPDDIKKWIEDGLKISDLQTLRANLSQYNFLFP